MTKEEALKFMETYISDLEDIEEVKATNTFFIKRYYRYYNKLSLYVVKDNDFHIIEVPSILYPTFYANRFIKAIGRYIFIFDTDIFEYERWGKDVNVDVGYVIDTFASLDKMQLEKDNYAICDYEYFGWNDFDEREIDAAIERIQEKVCFETSIKEIVDLLVNEFKFKNI